MLGQGFAERARVSGSAPSDTELKTPHCTRRADCPIGQNPETTMISPDLCHPALVALGGLCVTTPESTRAAACVSVQTELSAIATTETI